LIPFNSKLLSKTNPAKPLTNNLPLILVDSAIFSNNTSDSNYIIPIILVLPLVHYKLPYNTPFYNMKVENEMLPKYWDSPLVDVAATDDYN